MSLTNVKFYKIDRAVKPALEAIDLVLKDLKASILKSDDASGVIVIEISVLGKSQKVRFNVKPLSTNTSLIRIVAVKKENTFGRGEGGVTGVDLASLVFFAAAEQAEGLDRAHADRVAGSVLNTFITAAANRSVILSEYSAAKPKSLSGWGDPSSNNETAYTLIVAANWTLAAITPIIGGYALTLLPCDAIAIARFTLSIIFLSVPILTFIGWRRVKSSYWRESWTIGDRWNWIPLLYAGFCLLVALILLSRLNALPPGGGC